MEVVYEKPVIEVLEVPVETGFAATGTGDEEVSPSGFPDQPY